MQTPTLLVRFTQWRGPRIALLALVLVTTLWGSLAIAPQPASAAAAMTTARLNLRSGPGTRYGVILVIPSGAPLKITGSYNKGFYPVRYDGIKGWVAADYLTTGDSGAASAGDQLSASSTGTATVTSSLNLRSGPSTGDSVLLVMRTGAVVTLTGRASNGFVSVNYQGTNGWAYEAYLGSGGDTSSSEHDDGPVGTGYTTSAVNLRADASTASTILSVVPAGVVVSLTGASANGFYRVSVNGAGGWLYAAYVSLGDGRPGAGSAPGSDDNIPGGNAIAYATTTSSLNLRANSSLSARVITVMPSGASVALLDAPSNGFYPVSYNGTNGWASADFLATDGGTSSGNSGDDIVAIIYAAADAYGQSREDMLRVARCESGLDPSQVTPPYQASGLFQFLPGTWATTPYAAQDIFDPVANANAAAWMWSVGRRNEWVCQ